MKILSAQNLILPLKWMLHKIYYQTNQPLKISMITLEEQFSSQNPSYLVRQINEMKKDFLKLQFKIANLEDELLTLKREKISYERNSQKTKEN
jgi:hypothetical protein